MSDASDIADLAKETLAKPVIVTATDGRSWLYNPEAGVLTEVSSEHGMKLNPPPRIAASPVFVDQQSFNAYVNLYKTKPSLIFASMVDGKFSACLDYHAPDKPAFNAHAAYLALTPSEEWSRWTKIDDQYLTQLDFATFLEENAGDIVEPAGADIFELAKDLSAKRNVNWAKAVRLQNGDESFQYSEDTTLSSAAKGAVDIPRLVMLQLPIWFGDAPVKIQAHLRWKLDGGRLSLGTKMYRREFVRQATIKLIGTQITEATGVPVLYGKAT